jgi:phytoene synthase
MPKEKREAMRRIYEFCRYTDDLVDEPHEGDPLLRLQTWRDEVERCYSGEPSHPILEKLAPVLTRYNIPKGYLMTLIDGVEMDLTKSRYETIEELDRYCYAVAGIVGLISIQIFGYKHQETRDYAVALGCALQLTNILRDVGRDAAMGRIYLPLEDLRRFDYSEKELLNRTYNARFVKLMKFETDRARDKHAAARELLRNDERPTMFAAEIMEGIYFRMLQKIERAKYNVYARRIAVGVPMKLMLVFKFWITRNLPEFSQSFRR